MLNIECTALDGPDFLDAVADAERAQGNDINAAAYEQRAKEWRAERAEERRKREEVEQLLETIAHRRADPKPSRRRHAITPTDRAA
jgi:hypothetical protein